MLLFVCNFPAINICATILVHSSSTPYALLSLLMSLAFSSLSRKQERAPLKAC